MEAILSKMKEGMFPSFLSLVSATPITDSSSHPEWLQQHFTSSEYYTCVFKPKPPSETNPYSHFGLETIIDWGSVMNVHYYASSDLSHLIYVCEIGNNGSGNEGYCHGGLTATLMDTMMGTIGSCYVNCRIATKVLNVEYKKPILCGETIIISSYVEKASERSVKMKSEVYDKKHDLKVQSNAVFVKILNQWNNSAQKSPPTMSKGKL